MLAGGSGEPANRREGVGLYQKPCQNPCHFLSFLDIILVMPRNRTQGALTRSRELRSQMSLPEVLLWRELRRDVSGFRFRRQFAFGPYWLDFYCAAVALCIEIDGKQHEATVARDTARDAFLEGKGVVTLR